MRALALALALVACSSSSPPDACAVVESSPCSAVRLRCAEGTPVPSSCVEDPQAYPGFVFFCCAWGVSP